MQFDEHLKHGIKVPTFNWQERDVCRQNCQMFEIYGDNEVYVLRSVMWGCLSLVLQNLVDDLFDYLRSKTDDLRLIFDPVWQTPQARNLGPISCISAKARLWFERCSLKPFNIEFNSAVIAKQLHTSSKKAKYKFHVETYILTQTAARKTSWGHHPRPAALPKTS